MNSRIKVLIFTKQKILQRGNINNSKTRRRIEKIDAELATLLD